MNKITQRYATAFLELAKEENQIDLYQKDARTIIRVLKESEDLNEFLSHIVISKKDKKELLKDIFQNHIHDMVYRFLFVMIDKERSDLISDTLEEFDMLCNQEKGILSGIVYSVYPLDEKQIQEIEESIKGMIQHTVELNNQIDSSLLSGVKVVVNDKVIDGSLRGKIDSLKENLTKGVIR